jgi:hypothetical protein
MFELMRAFIGRIQYRRRWGRLAAAATAAADRATADLYWRERYRDLPHRPGEPEPSVARPRPLQRPGKVL